MKVRVLSGVFRRSGRIGIGIRLKNGIFCGFESHLRHFGTVAPILVERDPEEVGVVGSNPTSATCWFRKAATPRACRAHVPNGLRRFESYSQHLDVTVLIKRVTSTERLPIGEGTSLETRHTCIAYCRFDSCFLRLVTLGTLAGPPRSKRERPKGLESSTLSVTVTDCVIV